MIQREITVKVEPTPQELADEFAGMSSYDQAVFFNRLALRVSGWPPGCLSTQLQSISDQKVLNRGARTLMEKIGDYARAGR